MAETNTQLIAARAAKKKAVKLFEKLGSVSGVALTRRKGRYAVKVLLDAPLTSADAGPANIDGVPVVTQVVGPIKKQPRSSSVIKSARTATAKTVR